jgi:hypothetical protein
MNQIETVLRQLAENFRISIEAQVTTRYTAALDEYRKLRAPGKTCPRNIWPTHGNMSREAYRINQFRAARVSPFLTRTPRPIEEWRGQAHFMQGGITREEHITDVREDAAKLIELRAKSEAEEVIMAFVAKVGGKLNGIAEAMGNLSSAKLHGSTTLQNCIRLEFEDGSSFNVENDIIINHSVYGKPFNQFPTRFSNAVLRGEPVKNPSEAKMKKLFVAVPIEARPTAA